LPPVADYQADSMCQAILCKPNSLDYPSLAKYKAFADIPWFCADLSVVVITYGLLTPYVGFIQAISRIKNQLSMGSTQLFSCLKVGQLQNPLQLKNKIVA
jgi:hypothetical protein